MTRSRMKYSYCKCLIILLFFIVINGCESFVEVGAPRTQTVSSTAFADDITATATIRGIYHEMVSAGFASGLSSSVTVTTGTSSDEFKSYSPTLDEFYNNAITPSNTILNSQFWSSAYKNIYYSNSILEGLAASTALSSGTKKQLEGEAKFVRAFCLFYLTNLFGDVPIILSTDYRANSNVRRNAVGEVVDQIIKDLSEAQSLLTTDFQFTAGERVRPTSWAASALLSRVYLYKGDWEKTETYAAAVINSPLFRIVSDLNGVFLKNSTEAIWQLMPVVPGQNTNEALFYVPVSATSLPTYVSMTDRFMTSFESGDRRRTNWIGSQSVSGNTIFYPLKYKVFRSAQPVTEYSMVLRLAEQYLIRAEARARQNKFTEAMADLDVIRLRAGLPSIQTMIVVPTVDSIMQAIERERRIELFSEWGHRWFDLKRWNKADAILQPIKPMWSSTDVLFPIPQLEISNNPNLNPQNQGY